MFIWHRDELAHVEVWFCEGSALREQFDSWEEESPYSDPQQQRFRKSVNPSWVRAKATPVLRIVNGEAVEDWPSRP